MIYWWKSDGADRDLANVLWPQPRTILVVWRTFPQQFLRHLPPHLRRLLLPCPLNLIPPQCLICRPLWAAIHPVATRTQTSALLQSRLRNFQTNLNITLRNGVPEANTLQTNQHCREIRDVNAVGSASASHSSLITTDARKHISRCNLGTRWYFFWAVSTSIKWIVLTRTILIRKGSPTVGRSSFFQVIKGHHHRDTRI